MDQHKQHYEVIIAGGGIAGVTLALMFEKLGITYMLLEGRDTLESDRGAGIGLQPNGMRILDQLGLVEDIERATVPLTTWFSYDVEGNLMSTSSAMGQYRNKIGYPVVFIERPKLLPIMTRRIQRRDCIKTSARVASIEETDGHVVVTASDGFSVTADIIVGADGVRSAVRKHIDSSLSGGSVLSADDYLKVSFSTVYGMSASTEGIAPGERFAVYREQETVVGFTGQDGTVFWFVFEDLKKSVPLSRAPRYNEADAEALCKTVADVQVTPWLKFGDIFENRATAVKIAIEEGIAREWHTDRAVIVGDAACKTTPAGGQGANQAIESCAVLVNKLMEARKAAIDGKKLPREAIKSVLSSYAQTRAQPADTVLERSQMVCRALFREPGPASNMVREMTNLSDEDWLLRAFISLATAPILEDVELTARGHLYSQAVKAAQEETKRRMIAACKVAAVQQGSYTQMPTVSYNFKEQDKVTRSPLNVVKETVEVS
ncbi:FAD-dependent monooxygenase [Hypoxylon argillaceum]|nr:FAD-dependent monooxygenase [Hypoxylon argillaceum]